MKSFCLCWLLGSYLLCFSGCGPGAAEAVPYTEDETSIAEAELIDLELDRESPQRIHRGHNSPTNEAAPEAPQSPEIQKPASSAPGEIKETAPELIKPDAADEAQAAAQPESSIEYPGAGTCQEPPHVVGSATPLPCETASVEPAPAPPPPPEPVPEAAETQVAQTPTDAGSVAPVPLTEEEVEQIKEYLRLQQARADAPPVEEAPPAPEAATADHAQADHLQPMAERELMAFAENEIEVNGHVYVKKRTAQPEEAADPDLERTLKTPREPELKHTAPPLAKQAPSSPTLLQPEEWGKSDDFRPVVDVYSLDEKACKPCQRLREDMKRMPGIRFVWKKPSEAPPGLNIKGFPFLSWKAIDGTPRESVGWQSVESFVDFHTRTLRWDRKPPNSARPPQAQAPTQSFQGETYYPPARGRRMWRSGY